MVDIDLRWGVRKEAGYDQQTMKICLEEIKRCQKTKLKPNFIVLLGNKYGWQPAPSEIVSDEFEKIRTLSLVRNNQIETIESRHQQNPPSKCPFCNKPIRFNPFIVDNKNLY